MDGDYLLTRKSATSRFPKFSKDCPTVQAGREEGGKEAVPGSGKQVCVHPDSIDVGHVSPALSPTAPVHPHSQPQKTAQTLHTSRGLLAKRKNTFKNDQAQAGDKEEVTQERELHPDF